MGETRKAIFSSSQQGLAALIDEAGPLTVETPGGRIQIQWDYEAKATPNGQLAFFAEFLKTSGVYRKWVESCPLSYSSPNASEKGDVLGTWQLIFRRVRSSLPPLRFPGGPYCRCISDSYWCSF